MLLAVLVSAALWHAQRELLVDLDEATRRAVEVGDISALGRLVPLRDDELGHLAVNFNRMLDMLHELTEAATAVAEGDLGVRLERPGELHEAFRAMLEQLDRVVSRIRSTAGELVRAAAAIRAAMEAQDRVGDEQSRAVVSLEHSLRGLSDAASEIAEQAALVLADAEQASSATEASGREIVELRAHTVGIGGLLEDIREIADRTDLLALNGALEATRAGEAGRGFALVAAEMRRLAERVTGTVADVRGRIADIERASLSTKTVTERSRELAASTTGAAQRITVLIDEQDRGTKEVTTTVEGVAAAVDDVARAGAQTRAAAEGLEDQATRLEQLTRYFDRGTPT
jgi:methyl-accepting chemotaxis protein